MYTWKQGVTLKNEYGKIAQDNINNKTAHNNTICSLNIIVIITCAQIALNIIMWIDGIHKLFVKLCFVKLAIENSWKNTRQSTQIRLLKTRKAVLDVAIDLLQLLVSTVVVFLFLAGLWFTGAIINGPHFHPKLTLAAPTIGYCVSCCISCWLTRQDSIDS